jgi:hypothetical protein
MWETADRERVKEMETFYLHKLFLPPKFIQVLVALKNESIGDYKGAMDKWIEA